MKLALALAALAVALFATAIPGTVLVDEHAYISTIVGLRDGTYRVPETAGFSPSPELLSFDAAPRSRRLTETPAATNTPPLYAVLALPFALAGVRGLIAMQVLAFCLCAWLVFRVVRRETARTDLAWGALGVLVLATYVVEYAQGIWPHATTMALVMTAVDIASRLRHGAIRHVLPWAIVAGLCVGFATGMRYQNIAVVGTLATALWWARDRRRAFAGYALGAALPLVACAVINHARIGTWNPVSKGAWYTDVSRARSAGQAVADGVTSTYARLVDFTAWQTPPTAGEMPKAESGATVLRAGIKKALLQSAPWMAIPLFVLVAAWLSRRQRAANPLVKSLAIVVAGSLGMFALYGFRSDGWCFNQRYLLELVPLLVVTLAIALADWRPRAWVLAAGLAGGGLAAGAIVLASGSLGGQIAMMKVPLAIAALVTGAWFARTRYPRAFTAALGAALGWAAVVHLADDVPASRELRAYNRARVARFLAWENPGAPAALFAYGRNRDAYGPLLLDRRVVIFDPFLDDGRDVEALATEAARQGRIIYVDPAMPSAILKRIATARPVIVMGR